MSSEILVASSGRSTSPRFELALLALLIATGACSRAKDLGFSGEDNIDLLGRRPDEVLEQSGLRRPSLEQGFGADREQGWERWGHRRGSLVHAWSRQSKAYLRLDVIDAVDRRLELTLWRPESAPNGTRAEVSLNGIPLERLTLGTDPGDYTIEVPGPLWTRGSNVLAIDIGGTWPEDGRRVGFALARVRYDKARRVEIDTRTRRARMQGGTELVYGIEAPAPVRLFLQGRGQGRSTLEIRVDPFDPSTGEKLDAALVTQSIRLEGRAGEGDSLRRAIDLPPIPGKPLRLELRLQGPAASTFELERLELQESVPSERFGIIFCSIDTLSAAHLSTYGYGRATSPGLDRFARDAVVFEHCLTNAPWTLPSYMSQMTGLYPYSHRLYPRHDGELWELWNLASNRWTLAEFLRSSGYATAGFVDNDWITDRFGLTQGFDHYDASAASRPIDDPLGGIGMVTQLAREWLAGMAPHDPFFLFMHAFDVHGPYVSSPRFRGKFREGIDPSRSAPAGGDVAFGIIPTYVGRSLVSEGPLPPRMPVEELEAAYDEVVAMVDAELERFFEHLKEQGLYQGSVIIVSADHGETMSDSALMFGHGTLDPQVTDVPLIIKFPDNLHAGRRVSRRVQLVDLYPTIVDMLGHEPREGLHGRSLLPLVAGAELPERPLLCEGGVMRQAALILGRWKLVETTPGRDSSEPILLSNPSIDPAWAQSRRAQLLETGQQDLFKWLDNPALKSAFFEERARTGLTHELHQRLRSHAEYPELIRCLRRTLSDPIYALHDLEADPQARVDVSAEHPRVLAELQAALRTERERRDRSQRHSRAPQTPPLLGTEELQRLRDLGYVGSE